MKKNFLALTCIILVSIAQAQYKPTGGDISFEVQFTPLGNILSNLNNLHHSDIDMSHHSDYSDPQVISESTDFNQFITPIIGLNNGIKARYFVNDKLVARATIGFGNASKKTVVYDETNKYHATRVNSSTLVSFMPGIEFHIDGLSERISPYFGVEAGFSMGKVKSNYTNSENDYYAKSYANTTGFNLNLLAGFDYHITNGLYIGAEFGFGYDYSKMGAPTIEIKNATGTTTTESKNSVSDSKLSYYANPAIRLGWTF